MNFKVTDYDVIVVGAGHAGCEAALAAARMGCKTLVFTINIDNIAFMPFNPSFGGLGKSQLIKELDALGGEMGKVIDQTFMQIRALELSNDDCHKPLYALVDRKTYQMEMRLRLERQENLDIKQGEVEQILVENGKAMGIWTKNGALYYSKVVILATGTFLQGKISVGTIEKTAGRQGEMASVSLSNSLNELGLCLNRLKLYNAPRVLRQSIDFSKITEVKGSDDGLRFSRFSSISNRPQVSAFFSHITNETIDAMRKYADELDLKQLYDYKTKCKDGFQISIEPDGLQTDECYLAGLYNALPESVQIQIIRSIPGLEYAEMTRCGYLLEYDYLDPSQINHSLETKNIKGLFTAGQLNGTAGYEEAAVQGLIAGINSASFINGQTPLVLNREQSCIGILIDDLVSLDTTKPYTLQENAAIDTQSLLLNIGYQYELISSENDQQVSSKDNLPGTHNPIEGRG